MKITITAKVPGFRRAGLAHPAEPVTYPADRFTADQLAALRAEPNLVVVVSGAAEDEDTREREQTGGDGGVPAVPAEAAIDPEFPARTAWAGAGSMPPTAVTNSEGAPPVPEVAMAASGTERADGEAGGESAAAAPTDGDGEAGKDDGAAAGSAPEPGEPTETKPVAKAKPVKAKSTTKAKA